MRSPRTVAALVLLGAPHVAAAMAVKEGQSLPHLALKTLDDKAVTSDSWKGTATMIVFARPGHRRGEAALRDAMVARQDVGKVPWKAVLIVSGFVAKAAIEDMVKKAAFDGTVLVDPDMTVYGKFGVIVTPSTVVVDRRQQIVFAKPSHDFEYRRQLTANLKYATGLVDAGTRDRLVQTPAGEADKASAKNARWIRTAKSLAQAGELEHARVTLERVLAGSPECAPAMIEMGFVLLRLREPALALRWFDRAEAKAGPSPLTHLGGGIALVELGKLDQAEKRLKDGLALSPRPALAHYALGRLYERQRKAEEALAHYKAAARTLLDREEGGHYLPADRDDKPKE